MTRSPSKAGPPALSNYHADLAERVGAALRRADSHASEAAKGYLDAGQLLIEAKEGLPHGQWLPFLERAGTHKRTAQRLMRIARAGMTPDTLASMGLVAAAASLAKPSNGTPESNLPLPKPDPPKPKVSRFRERYATDPAFRAKKAEYNRAERQRRKLRQAREGAPMRKDTERQEKHAAENEATAQALEEAGLHHFAKGYRRAAKVHRECAERITREALEGFFGGLNAALK